MSTAPSVPQYLRLFWACINPFIKKWMLPMHGVIGALDLYHTHLPAPLNTLDIFDFFPSWSLLNWALIAAIIVLIASCDGLLWERHLIQEAQSRLKPLVDPKGIPYEITKNRGAAKFIAPATIFIVLTGAYILLPQEVKRKELTLPAPSPSATDTKTTRPPETPTVLVRYSQMELPIAVQPHETALVFQLSPFITDQTFQVINSGKNLMWWPHGPTDPKHEPQIGRIYVCELTNHGSKALLNTELKFVVKFLEANRLQAWTANNADGTSSISINVPPKVNEDNRTSFAMEDAKHRVIAAISGNIVSQHTHRITIPAITAGGKAIVYFVSQTKYFTQFSLPNEATTVVEGNTDTRTAALIRPAMNPVDRAKEWGLSPSIYPWPSIQESMMNLDDYLALKP